jgi:hypothetical protein
MCGNHIQKFRQTNYQGMLLIQVIVNSYSFSNDHIDGETTEIIDTFLILRIFFYQKKNIFINPP